MRDRSKQPRPEPAQLPQTAPPEHHSPPWRVEGARPPAEDAASSSGGRPLHRRPGIMLPLLLLLVINWVVVLSLPTTASRVTVPYSYFAGQAKAGNVTQINSQGATLQGTFRRAVHYPPGAKTATTQFKTERPTFADDHLLSL